MTLERSLTFEAAIELLRAAKQHGPTIVHWQHGEPKQIHVPGPATVIQLDKPERTR